MGVCRGETYDRTGDLSGRSVTCETNRAAILQMLWTLSERPEVARTGGGHHVG